MIETIDAGGITLILWINVFSITVCIYLLSHIISNQKLEYQSRYILWILIALSIFIFSLVSMVIVKVLKSDWILRLLLLIFTWIIIPFLSTLYVISRKYLKNFEQRTSFNNIILFILSINTIIIYFLIYYFNEIPLVESLIIWGWIILSAFFINYIRALYGYILKIYWKRFWLLLDHSLNRLNKEKWECNKKRIEYLFSWNDIPGNDNVRLIEFLTQNFSIDWVKTAKIEKTDDFTINVSTENAEKNHLSLKLNDEKTEVDLIIDDGRTEELTAQRENGKINIYYTDIRFPTGLNLLDKLVKDSENDKRKGIRSGSVILFEGEVGTRLGHMMVHLLYLGLQQGNYSIYIAANKPPDYVLENFDNNISKANEDINNFIKSIASLQEILKNKYLFGWEKIPGDDNQRLIEFLTQNFGIDWVKTAKIEKTDDFTINVSTENAEKNHLSLKLNDEKIEVNLKIDDGRTEELTAQMENGKLNIYKNNYLGNSIIRDFIYYLEKFTYKDLWGVGKLEADLKKIIRKDTFNESKLKKLIKDKLIDELYRPNQDDDDILPKFKDYLKSRNDKPGFLFVIDYNAGLIGEKQKNDLYRNYKKEKQYLEVTHVHDIGNMHDCLKNIQMIINIKDPEYQKPIRQVYDTTSTIFYSTAVDEDMLHKTMTMFFHQFSSAKEDDYIIFHSFKKGLPEEKYLKHLEDIADGIVSLSVNRDIADESVRFLQIVKMENVISTNKLPYRVKDGFIEEMWW